jgi:hypothetical protein
MDWRSNVKATTNKLDQLLEELRSHFDYEGNRERDPELLAAYERAAGPLRELVEDAAQKAITEIAWALEAFDFAKGDQGDRGNCYFQLEQAANKLRAALAKIDAD